MPEKLKPCPCGQDATFARWSDYGYLDECNQRRTKVTCTRCGISTRDFPSDDESATAWNTRPREAALEAEVARLRALVVEAYGEGFYDGCEEGDNGMSETYWGHSVTKRDLAKAALDAAGEATDA
jgi:hypothetical protein